MKPRQSLVDAMERLNRESIEMASLALSHLQQAFHAFEKADHEEAKHVMTLDDLVDQYEEKIAKHALKVIWKEQPVASDLRLVTGILKMITDIERIGDHASDIAYMTTQLKKALDSSVHPLATKIMSNLETMYLLTIEALKKHDEILAKEVIKQDDMINTGYKDALKHVTTLIKEEKIEAEEAVHILMVLKYLEKIGDHATNIAEWIIFTLTGIHKHTELY